MRTEGHSRGLELPPQEKPGKDSFDLRPGKVSAWVNALPVGNVGETTKLLYQALVDANHHQHSWKRRYHFLESIREPLHLVQQAISRRYHGHGIPLQQKTQQMANLSLNLDLEMAIGYKRAIEDMLTSMVLFQSRHVLKIMVHRACRYLSQNLLTSFQLYSQQQAGAWRELNHLYTFASKQDFHQDPISDKLFTDLPESSIARVYKQIVLLATASPFNLRQGEASTIYQALARWSAHAKLLSVDDSEAEHALFIIHLERDYEPEYRSLDHQPDDAGARLLIDMRQLLHILDEESRYLTNSPGTLLTAELIGRLRHSWEIAPKRGEYRNENEQNIHVIAGMTNIHALLAKSMRDELMTAHPSHFESRAVPKVEARAQPGGDVWNSFSGKSPSPAPKIDTHQESATQSSEVETLLWKVRNESPGGFRLSIPESRSNGIRVGELLAMREELSRSRWTLGVVRWLRQFPHTGAEAGVQLIAPHMIPVMIKNLTPGKDKGEYQRGLLLPSMDGSGERPTLITPNKIFMPSERVTLHIQQNEVEALLDKAIQDGATFVQFNFSTERPDDAMKQDSNAETLAEHPFDSLWDQL